MEWYVWLGIAVGGCLAFTLIGWLIDKLIREPLHRRKIKKNNAKQIKAYNNTFKPTKKDG